LKASNLLSFFIIICCSCHCYGQQNNIYSLSHKAGFYNKPFYLKISSKQGNVQFFKENNIHKERKKFPDSLLIDKTQNICLVLKTKDSMINLGCFSYFIDFKTKIKVVSISINHSYLFDSIKGIYMKGPNAYYDSVYKHYRNVNFEKKWEKENYVEVFNELGQRIINQKSGIKIFGGMTKYLPEKSLRLIARSQYGINRFDADLFGSGKRKYKQFILRHSGGDYRSLRFKDAFTTTFAKESGLDVQESSPAHVFINSEYWGVYNIREKINEYFINNHYDCGIDGIDLLQGNSNIEEGLKTKYLSLINFIKKNKISNNQNYLEVNKMMDTRNFMNFWIHQIYYANQDVRGNIRYWRSDSLDGKFRWIVYDTDLGFAPNITRRNMLKDFTSPTKTRWYNPTWATFLLRKLLTNQNFKKDFILQSCFILNTTLSKKNIQKRIEEFKKTYQQEMEIHFKQRKLFQKWQGSMENWHDCIKGLYNFSNKRTLYSFTHLEEVFKLNKPYLLKLKINKPQNGYIQLNGNRLKQSELSAYFYSEHPLPISIHPNIGYDYSGYTKKTIHAKSGDSISINITFKQKEPSKRKIVFNEIDYINNCFEIFNQENNEIDMSGWKLVDLNKHVYTIDNLLIPKGGFAVFHFGNNIKKIDGVFYKKINFKISSQKEQLQLFDKNERIVDNVSYELKESKKSYSRNIPFEKVDNIKPKWKNNNDLTMGYHNTSYTKLIKTDSSNKILYLIVLISGTLLCIGFFFYKRKKRQEI